MSIPQAEVQTLTPGSLITLWKVDCSAPAIGGGIYYLASQLNTLGTPIVWQGQTYTPIPIEGSGFEYSTQGALPHPQLAVSNLDGLINTLVSSLQDMVGAIVTRIRVLYKYIDAVNYPGSVNPNADPTAGFLTDQWIIEQKIAQLPQSFTFELVAACDAQGLTLPARQINTSTCMHGYMNDDGLGLCPYSGPLASCDRGLYSANGCSAHFNPKSSTANFSVTATNTITRDTGSFLTDNFYASLSIALNGFTVAGNNILCTIASVTATTIVVSGTPLTIESAASGKSILGMNNLPFGGFPGTRIQPQ